MVWKDPSEPQDTLQQQPISDSEYQGGYSDPTLGNLNPAGVGALPPIQSYGQPGMTWNKETMELLVDIEIPKESLSNGRNTNLFVWAKKVLMQLQFGNYTAKDRKRMIKALRYIIFMSQQEGNEQIVFEEQLMFVSELMISKGSSDKPDGMRERTFWGMQLIKNIFSQDEAKRPEENKSTWNLPFMR